MSVSFIRGLRFLDDKIEIMDEWGGVHEVDELIDAGKKRDYFAITTTGRVYARRGYDNISYYERIMDRR